MCIICHYRTRKVIDRLKEASAGKKDIKDLKKKLAAKELTVPEDLLTALLHPRCTACVPSVTHTSHVARHATSKLHNRLPTA